MFTRKRTCNQILLRTSLITRGHHKYDGKPTRGWKAALQEAHLPSTEYYKRIQEDQRNGLPAATSIHDRDISTFSRSFSPYFAGINTFLKSPYLQDVTQAHKYDVTVVGVPFDGGCTYRPGSRFGPQAIRRMTALYSPPYSFEQAVDLTESITMCDVGDVYTIPANIEKTLDQVSNAIAHIASTGSFPLVIGGDHSIGFATIRGITSVTTKNIGIIHFDRHADMQEKDMDERMHSTPYFHATNLPNVRPENLVQIGIGGWQVPRPAISQIVGRKTNIFTMDDLDDLGIDKVVEMALDRAWDGCDAVYMSFDIDVLDPAFAPGTGTPDPGGLFPRDAFKLVWNIAKEGLCGMEIVEVSPPYDGPSDITSLIAVRLYLEALGAMVSHHTLGNHKKMIDKEFQPF